MKPQANPRLGVYYLTSIVSLVIAVVGFSYNTWRLEVTEDNSNIRTAAFAVFTHLAEFEQILYAAHYDQNPIDGSPRKGWVKVGMVKDLSLFISAETQTKADKLHKNWQQNWQEIENNVEVVNQLVEDIDVVREEIKVTLASLN